MTDTEIIDFIERHNLTVAKADGAADYRNTVLAQHVAKDGTETVVAAPSVRQAVEDMAKEIER